MHIRSALKSADTNSAIYRGAFVHPNLSSTTPNDGEFQLASTLLTPPDMRLSAGGHEFEVVTVKRPGKRFRVYNSGTQKLEHNRFGHFERQRRSSRDSELKRQFLDLRSREHLASAFERDKVGEEPNSSSFACPVCDDEQCSCSCDSVSNAAFTHDDFYDCRADYDYYDDHDGHEDSGYDRHDDGDSYSSGGYYLGGYNRLGVSRPNRSSPSNTRWRQCTICTSVPIAATAAASRTAAATGPVPIGCRSAKPCSASDDRHELQICPELLSAAPQLGQGDKP